MKIFTPEIKAFRFLTFFFILIFTQSFIVVNAQGFGTSKKRDSLYSIPNSRLVCDSDSSTVCGTIIGVHIRSGRDAQQAFWKDGQKTVKNQQPLFAFKTNLLYDLATIVNASLEIPIGKRWSIAAEFIFPWWLDQKRQNALQVYNGNLEVKHWFNPRENQRLGQFSAMTGWFMGIYGGVAFYDLEYNCKGYQGEALSAGLMGGYAHSIGKHLRMEYSLGLGYMQTHYHTYKSKMVDNEWLLYRQNSSKATWIGPTQIKISLVWMLSRNTKKGGIQ